jgi:hypothetical protein
MPNWVYNEVEVHASLEEVQPYLAVDSDMGDPNRPVTRFNLHRLYPERFAVDDPCGHRAWNYDWMVENTGAKWNPTISAISE